MFLKSLTIKGFKSFAKKTHIVFEPGLSVIIGPNGSGKSNIVDAVLWVLGEQNPRFLRGKSMVDIIFSGTEFEKPMPFAEVTLVFDNSDKSLPVDASEVSIKRRLMREGDNTYFINEKPCRLLDVHDLILKAGLGEELPGIIPQNRLDDLINPSSTDLRAIIEEASGIALYKKRRENALKRMVSVDEKIEKISLVKREVDSEIKPLKKQVERMKAAIEIKNRLNDVWMKLKVSELVSLEERWDSLKREESLTESTLSEFIKKETEFEERRKSLELVYSIEGKVEEEITLRQRIAEVSEKISVYRSILEEKGKNIIENFSKMRQQFFTLESRRKALLGKRKSLSDEIVEITKKIEQMETENDELKVKAEEFDKSKVVEVDALEKNRKKLQIFEDELRQLEYQVKDYKNKVSQIESQIYEQSKRNVISKEEIEQKTKKKLEEESKFFELEMKLNSHKNTKNKISSKLSELKEGLSELKANIEVYRIREQSLLEEVKSLKTIIKGRKAQGKKKIFELLKQQENKKIPLSIVLGWLANAVKVDIDNAEKIVADEKGEEELLVIDFKKNEGLKKGTLLEYVENPDELPYSVKRILGLYSVVKTNQDVISSYKKSPGKGYISESGVAITPEGVLILKAPPDNSLTIIERIEKLENELACLQRNKGKLEIDFAKKKERIRELEFQLKKICHEIVEVERNNTGLRESIARQENETLSKERMIEEREIEIELLGKEKLKIEKEIEKISKIIKEKLIKVGDLKKVVDKKNKEIVELEHDIWNLKSRSDQISLLISERKEKKEYLAREKENIIKELEKIEDEMETYKSLTESLEKVRKRIMKLHSLYQEYSVTISYLSQILETTTTSSWEKFENYKNEINQILSDVREINLQKEKLLKRKEILTAQLSQVETNVSLISREFVEKTGVTVKKAIEEYFDPDDNTATLKTEYEKLKKDFELLGDYNPLAERDYERLKGRSGFLKKQIADLREACANLETIITEVNRKMTYIFIRDLKKVSEIFSQKFIYLFPGGEARLNLTEPESPLDSQIEIFARPRGKKLERISLLSGGEKAMVALALVFAIEEVFKIPFLILDEVEPSLDELNLNRLIHLIQETSKRNQVIIISHQPKTIEEADVVYGVTMNRSGISSVYCQKFKEVS